MPYWEMDEAIVDHIAATDLTTLALFSVTHGGMVSSMTSQNGYRKIAGAIGDS